MDNRTINLAYGEAFLTIEVTHDDQIPRREKDQEISPDALIAVDAPMDGMFYLSPSPEKPPFINVGDEITPGQTVGLIEVMKCFYPVKFQGMKATKVVSIQVSNATPVTSGTAIFMVTR